MPFTHYLTRGWSNGGSDLNNTVAKTAGAENNIDESIAQSQTDKAVAFACDVSQLKALYIVADQDMTVETNDGSSPGDTLALAAGVPIEWAEGDAADCPFSVDVTSLFVTTGAIGAAGGTLKIRSLIDPTV